jgi:hypothetical protein
MKILKKILWALLAIFVIAQFFRPDKNVSDTVPMTDFIVVEQPPQRIAEMIKTSCYDCHSNNTKYPWYNAITPVNYWLGGHVRHGKGEFNFSTWQEYSPRKKDHKLEEFVELVEKHEMPLESYLWMHSDAKLNSEQIEQLTNWVTTLRLKYKTASKAE